MRTLQGQIHERSTRVVIGLSLMLVLILSSAPVVFGAVSLRQLSSDPYTNSTSQHQTEVEPDTLAFGQTIVATFQVGRFSDGGASNIGWATSSNGGSSWSSGFLPGITTFQSGLYARVSDPSVAYDARHGVWLIASLALSDSSSAIPGVAILVSRSTDGVQWGNPVHVKDVDAGSDFDKDWIVCDNTATSPHYGQCYVQWDDHGQNNLILMSTSSDGAASWGRPMPTADRATGIAGQPVVQPNGTVVVPVANATETALLSFRSTDGGASWSRTVRIANVIDHNVAGNLRTAPDPSAEVDGVGTVYVVWQDCRFERGCGANDIVLSTSADGLRWSSVARIPIDQVRSGVDHFIPGLAVDKGSSGTGARLALSYYYYPKANCTPTTCQLNVGFVASSDGGKTWSLPTQLAGPMLLSWLPNTTLGYMVGDYISTSFASSTAYPVFALASAPSGATLAEAMFTPATGLAASSAITAAASAEGALPGSTADHPARTVPIVHR